MPKSRSLEPRTEQLLLRLSPRHMAILEAVAFLAGGTPNAYVYDLLEAHLAVVARDEVVLTALQAKAQFEWRGSQGSTSSLRPRRIAGSGGQGLGEAQESG